MLGQEACNLTVASGWFSNDTKVRPFQASQVSRFPLLLVKSQLLKSLA
jgi:hypothetical protein